MPCVNHPENATQSYCQHCGKALCATCVRTTPAGQIYCDNCMAATAGGARDPGPAGWAGAINQGVGVPGFSIPLGGGPNPAAAAVLGLIPGVGAMYNGQLFKGLIHVVVFAVLVSITDRYQIFLIFVFAWVFYQSFEAYHTAKARRDGLPVPDPFGLNEVGNWLNLNATARFHGNQQTSNPNQSQNQSQSPPPYTTSWTAGTGAVPGSAPGGSVEGTPESTAQGYAQQQAPNTEPWSGSWSGYGAGYGSAPAPGQEPYPGSVPPIPPIAPIPPYNWRRREPVFAFVLIGLGIIFLLQSMGFVSHILHYIWPFLLIGLGVWLIIRRIGETQGGSK